MRSIRTVHLINIAAFLVGSILKFSALFARRVHSATALSLFATQPCTRHLRCLSLSNFIPATVVCLFEGLQICTMFTFFSSYIFHSNVSLSSARNSLEFRYSSLLVSLALEIFASFTWHLQRVALLTVLIWRSVNGILEIREIHRIQC